uniref:PilT domain protein n=1 Tax=Acetithermum autotrophicum TaxID=1446466 RepID=H5SSR2_ACEAU|nr:PilT domain protein [Candidatus Acetothermum autotrophicum]
MSPKAGSKSVVIDASVLLAFYLPAEPYKTQALVLLEEATAGRVKLVVPTLTHYEVLNVLSLATRGLKRGQKISLDEAQEILTAMKALKLEVRDVQSLEKRILEITQRHQCSAYDAAYLALAEQWGADLLTGDERFYNALKAHFKQVKFVGSYKAQPAP